MKNSDSKKIRKAIELFFKTHTGTFRGWQISNFCKKCYKLEKDAEPDTIRRYMRQMRERGMIDYEIVNKKDSLYKIKEI